MEHHPTFEQLVSITPLCVRAVIRYELDAGSSLLSDPAIGKSLFGIPSIENPLIICSYFNRDEFKEKLQKTQNKLFSFYHEKVKELDWSPFLKGYLKSNSVFFILLILYAMNPGLIEVYVNRLLPDPERIKKYSIRADREFDPYLTSHYVNSFLSALRMSWQRQMDEVASPAFLKECIHFYWDLHVVVKSLNRLYYLNSEEQLGWVPYVWPERFRKRLVLCSYLKNSTEIFKALRSSAYPRMIVVDRERKNKHLKIELLEDLFSSLPKFTAKPPPTTAQTKLTEISDIIYGTNPIKLKQSNLEPLPGAHKVNFAFRDLLEQALVLSTMNWDELWCKKQYKRTSQTIQRLYYLKDKLNFVLEATIIVPLLFSMP